MKLPDIGNAFENVKEACEKRINDLYPAGIPDIVKDRYEKELGYLEKSEYVNEFEIARRLFDRANNDRYSYFITIHGEVISSFIMYLISESKINPLPAHYYCQKCGHFEAANTKLFGIDLESIKCPSCGNTIYPDGFNFPIENVFGVNGKTDKDLTFDYDVSMDFYPIAKEILEKTFPNNAIEPSHLYGPRPSEYIIFPEGKGINDYPQYIERLPSGDICVSRSIHQEPVWDFYMMGIWTTDCKIRTINEFQLRTDLYVKDIPLHEMLNVTWKDIHDGKYLMDPDSKGYFRKYEPATFYAMTNYMAGSLNHYVKKFPYTHDQYWQYETDAYKVYALKGFEKYPCYTCEDFFETLMTLGLDREKAYEITELISQSNAEDENPVECEKLKQFFEEENIDKAFKTVLKRCGLIFHRARVIDDLLTDLILLYLSKQDREIYEEILDYIYEIKQ